MHGNPQVLSRHVQCPFRALIGYFNMSHAGEQKPRTILETGCYLPTLMVLLEIQLLIETHYAYHVQLLGCRKRGVASQVALE
jgi:hypothetical protein